MNCVNIQNGHLSNSNTSAPSNFNKINKESFPNSSSGVKSPEVNNINHSSPKEKLDQNINEVQTAPPRINIKNF